MTDVDDAQAARWPLPCIAAVLPITMGCTSAVQRSIHSPSPVPPDPPTIAIHSDPDGRDDTYVMNDEGTTVAAVTDGMETVAQPYWLPVRSASGLGMQGW
ncbi:MAG: hypothetical protein ABI595_13140 [Actinomycetota bacterium]